MAILAIRDSNAQSDPSFKGKQIKIVVGFIAPEFLAEAKKRESDVKYVGGQEFEAIAKKAVSQTPETIARLKQILAE
jgi:hypothetical protein